MAETVLSMASSMLGSAASKAAVAAADEMSLLMGVQKEIWFMKDELETMQAFLVAPEVTKKKDKLVKVWAKQVRDLSYDIEDCLDEFAVHARSQSLTRQLMKLKDRHRIAIKIRNLKSRVEEVSNRNARYNLIKTEAPNTIDETESYMEDIRSHSAINIDEAQLVGFDISKKKLLEMIHAGNSDGHAQVICVVGTGGLGKTTLARKIYESTDDIKKNFPCCAWITVSQSFLKIEMLKDMIRQLLGEESLKQIEGKMVQAKDLSEYLMKELRDKRYFIVFDDLWTNDAWNWIDTFGFPKTNSKHSRIIVTTRDVGLAKQCTSASLIYHLEPLKLDDAIELLLRKTQKSHNDMKNNENMEETITKLAKKCGRLPLAILTIGGVLATKKIEDWKHFYETLPSELESNPSLEAIRRMVTLSYDHLPSYLKPCFLYLSIFPEDFEIKRRHLVDRWIAEGLVSRSSVGVTIDDVGEMYFNELINRSMIQASRVDIEGLIKSCRVHDIVRDIIVSISREENFVCSPGDNVPRATEENFRHVAFHGSNGLNVRMNWSRVRSITIFGERPMQPKSSLCSPELRMLRTLDLQQAEFTVTQKDINDIGSLQHLKYINSCQFAYIYELPRSIGKLQGLQVLDVRNSYIATLPVEISKLSSLRVLRCSKETVYADYDIDQPANCLINTLRMPRIFTPLFDSEDRSRMVAELHMAYSSRWSRVDGVKVPRGISNLKALQILETVDIKRTSNKAIQELGELSHLRKLRVATRGSSDEKYKTFCEAVEKLSSLRSLRINDYGMSSRAVERIDFISRPPPLLRKLTLIGYILAMPDWFGNLTQLAQIRLSRCRLKEGRSMEILGALPRLMLLVLYLDAYVGEKLVFLPGAFPNLRKLDIWSLDELREIGFQEGASPQMETILIGGCRLESGVNGIKHLPKLREISLRYGSKVARLGMLEKEVGAHPNHPALRLEEDRSKHDLGDPQGSGVVQAGATESVPCLDGEGSQPQATTPTAS